MYRRMPARDTESLHSILASHLQQQTHHVSRPYENLTCDFRLTQSAARGVLFMDGWFWSVALPDFDGEAFIPVGLRNEPVLVKVDLLDASAVSCLQLRFGKSDLRCCLAFIEPHVEIPAAKLVVLGGKAGRNHDGDVTVSGG